MNFTREPILETIISAKEGYKLRLKSTKNDGTLEYLVDAVEVVCFGTTFFYRSLEPAHTFFVPAQDFEIVQVRQARLMLKTPTEKNIKIAGGDTSKKSKDEKPQEKKKSKSKSKSSDKKSEDKKDDKKDEKKTEAVKDEKAESKEKEDNSRADEKSKKEENKDDKKDSRKFKKENKEKSSKSPENKPSGKEPSKDVSEVKVQATPSMFSHLLRPPESLISDSIGKYQSMMTAQDDKVTKEVELTTSPMVDKQEGAALSSDNPIDDPNLTSEPPKPFEKLTEESAETEEASFSLKETVKKVLSSSLKEGKKKESDSGE